LETFQRKERIKSVFLCLKPVNKIQEVFEKLQIQKRKGIRVKKKLTTYLNTIFWRKQRLMRVDDEVEDEEEWR
jgi:hypothetical protein